MADFSIREMTENDINDVMKVDSASFSAPWTKAIFEQEINQNNYAHYFVVEEEKSKIIGSFLFKRR